jgi:PAS domain S-box-containing protein
VPNVRTPAGTALASLGTGRVTVVTRDGVEKSSARRTLAVAVALLLAIGVLATLAGPGLIGRWQVTVAIITTSNAFVLVGFAVVTARGVAESEHGRVDAEQEAQASHNQLQNLIDNTSALIYMKRIDDGRYVLVNREWERMFKVPRDAVVNFTDREVFPPGLAEQLRANDLMVASTGRTVQFEESTDSDEGMLWYVSVKFPVLDGAGKAYAVCGISTDITDRKRAEEEVRRLNTDLEARVDERTGELEASTRELDAFAYSVSHDLRAPLRSLHGFSQALLDDYGDVLDDDGQDFLRRIQRNVQRMGQMIDDLLDLSRATRVDLVRESVDLSALAGEIVAELGAADPDRKVTTIIPDSMAVSGDPRLLRLALQNLLANAWKFSAKLPVATIEVGHVQRDGERVYFVRDDGAGFDMRFVDKLFNAFQRLHPTAEFEGNGVGLAIVQRIVRRHGGRLSAESEPGRGATFYFTLSAATGAAA